MADRCGRLGASGLDAGPPIPVDARTVQNGVAILSVLFFLHIPKCAGMSLTDALLGRLDAGEIYQSTSLIRNYRENRPEFLQITNHHRLRAVVGHWLHEAMLPPLRKPIVFASSIRHPVDRIRSQYRFDMGMRGPKWQPESPEVFLERSRNVIVSFVSRAFPSIAARHSNPVDACKAILSGMDYLFPVSDADRRIPELVSGVLGDVGAIPRTNESGSVTAELEFSDDRIAEYCELDLQVWEWFSAAARAAPKARNPVHDREVRGAFAELGARPFQPDILAAYLAPKIANDLRNDLQDARSAATRLAAATDMALRTERALQALLRAD